MAWGYRRTFSLSHSFSCPEEIKKKKKGDITPPSSLLLRGRLETIAIFQTSQCRFFPHSVH